MNSPSQLTLLAALLHLLSTGAMAGIIWVVQLVVYPAFEQVPDTELSRYASRHARRITPIVLAFMSVELLTFGLLMMREASRVPNWLVATGSVSLAAVWLSTLCWQVPLHGRLQAGDRGAAGALVKSNWLRTLCWSARALIAVVIVLVLAQRR